MLKKTSKFIPFFVILTIAITVPKYAEGIAINVTGDWDLVINDTYFTWEGGLQDTYESDVNLTISDANKINWELDVRRSDTNWHSDFVLKLLKLEKPRKEVTVETTSKLFFADRDNKSYGIKVILEGVSLQISPDTYVTTVIYTVTEK